METPKFGSKFVLIPTAGRDFFKAHVGPWYILNVDRVGMPAFIQVQKAT